MCASRSSLTLTRIPYSVFSSQCIQFICVQDIYQFVQCIETINKCIECQPLNVIQKLDQGKQLTSRHRKQTVNMKSHFSRESTQIALFSKSRMFRLNFVDSLCSVICTVWCVWPPILPWSWTSSFDCHLNSSILVYETLKLFFPLICFEFNWSSFVQCTETIIKFKVMVTRITSVDVCWYMTLNKWLFLCLGILLRKKVVLASS